MTSSTGASEGNLTSFVRPLAASIPMPLTGLTLVHPTSSFWTEHPCSKFQQLDTMTRMILCQPCDGYPDRRTLRLRIIENRCANLESPQHKLSFLSMERDTAAGYLDRLVTHYRRCVRRGVVPKTTLQPLPCQYKLEPGYPCGFLLPRP